MQLRRPIAALVTALALFGGGATMTACQAAGQDQNDGSTDENEPPNVETDDESDPSQDNVRSEEHTSELQSRQYLVCRLLLEKKKYNMKVKPPSHVVVSHCSGPVASNQGPSSLIMGISPACPRAAGVAWDIDSVIHHCGRDAG